MQFHWYNNQENTYYTIYIQFKSCVISSFFTVSHEFVFMLSHADKRTAWGKDKCCFCANSLHS